MTDQTAINAPDDTRLTTTSAPHAGMPALDETAARTSLFEFWPFWAFYAPVILHILWLVIRHRGPTLMCNSNPGIPMSGFVGERKIAVMEAVKGPARRWIAPYVGMVNDGATEHVLDKALTAMAEAGLAFPVVAKPDIGMRGAGVQVMRCLADLRAYIAEFPVNATLVLQELVAVEGEVGVYYVRLPGEKKGKITGLTLKYFPSITGDGVRTLGQLIDADPRAGKLRHLYLDRFKKRWDEKLPKGESVRLSFAGNHSKGCIFRDGGAFMTGALAARLDEIADAMDGFHVGRFDLRFGRFDDLQRGTGFRIIEINGAGGENTQIWDSRTRLVQAWKILFAQNQVLWQIGAVHRARGIKPPTLGALVRAWRQEATLTKHYPHTH